MLLHTFSMAPFFGILCFISPNSCSQQISVRSTTLLLFARRLQTGEPAGITREEMTVVASESRVIINTGQMHEIAFTASGLTCRKCPIYLVQQFLGYVCLFKPFILSCPVQDSMCRERERERECDVITESACPFSHKQMHGKILSINLQ